MSLPNNFHTNLMEISEKLEHFSKQSREKMVTDCVNRHLDEAMNFYLGEITGAEEYLIERKGYIVFAEIQKIQKKRLKEAKARRLLEEKNRQLYKDTGRQESMETFLAENGDLEEDSNEDDTENSEEEINNYE